MTHHEASGSESRNPVFPPLARTEEDALAMPGDLYRGFKGGIYRRLGTGTMNPGRDGLPHVYKQCCTALFCEAADMAFGEPVSLYEVTRGKDDVEYWAIPEIFPKTCAPVPVVLLEHLWPNPHRTWAIPEHLFAGMTDDGRVRFVSIDTPSCYGDIQ